MKYFFLFILFVSIYSCGYSDIDSVPDFKEIQITEQDAIELCNLSNADRKGLLQCLVNYYEKQKIKDNINQ